MNANVQQQQNRFTDRKAKGKGWVINILDAEWFIATKLRPTRRNQRGHNVNKPILDRN